MKARIIPIGNSQGIRIPKPLIEQACLKGDVEIDVQNGCLVIKPTHSLVPAGGRHFKKWPNAVMTACLMMCPLPPPGMKVNGRGHATADVEAIQETLLRISRLVEEIPEISELDLNPIFALPPGKGCRVADARIEVKVPK